MPTTKTPSQAGDKFNRRASVAGPDYEEGVRNPRRPWAASTTAASQAYDQGVQAAIQRGAFAKGVQEAGDSKWANRAASVGVMRYPQGVAASQDAYERAIGPFLDVIERTQLPPRYPRGDPRNYARVQAIGDALHKLKIA